MSNVKYVGEGDHITAKSSKVLNDNVRPSKVYIDNYSKIKWTSKKSVKKMYFEDHNK